MKSILRGVRQTRGRSKRIVTPSCLKCPAAQLGSQRFIHQTAVPTARLSVHDDHCARVSNWPPSPHPSKMYDGRNCDAPPQTLSRGTVAEDASSTGTPTSVRSRLVATAQTNRVWGIVRNGTAGTGRIVRGACRGLSDAGL